MNGQRRARDEGDREVKKNIGVGDTADKNDFYNRIGFRKKK